MLAEVSGPEDGHVGRCAFHRTRDTHLVFGSLSFSFSYACSCSSSSSYSSSCSRSLKVGPSLSCVFRSRAESRV